MRDKDDIWFAIEQRATGYDVRPVNANGWTLLACSALGMFVVAPIVFLLLRSWWEDAAFAATGIVFAGTIAVTIALIFDKGERIS